MTKEEMILKAEVLLDQAEAAFELAQDSITDPADFDALWARGNYRLSLANSYIGLAQVKNVEGVADAMHAQMEVEK